MTKPAHSILTTAALNADAKAKENEEPQVTETDVFTISINKKLFKKAAIAGALGLAASYVVTRLLNSTDIEDEETSDAQD